MTEKEQELLNRIEKACQAMCIKTDDGAERLKNQLQEMCDQAYSEGVVPYKLVVEVEIPGNILDVKITRVVESLELPELRGDEIEMR